MLIFEGDQKDFILSRKKLCEQPGNQYSYPDFCSPTFAVPGMVLEYDSGMTCSPYPDVHCKWLAQCSRDATCHSSVPITKDKKKSSATLK